MRIERDERVRGSETKRSRRKRRRGREDEGGMSERVVDIKKKRANDVNFNTGA